MQKEKYIEVIVDRNIPSLGSRLTYKTNKINGDIKNGAVVKIPLQNKKIKGIVWRKQTKVSGIHKIGKIREVLEVVRSQSIIWPWQTELAEWMGRYYMASLARIIKLMVPEGCWGKLEEYWEEIGGAGKKRRGMEIEKGCFKELNSEQKMALHTIMLSNKPVLIHGVTGSGKTEIYLQAIYNIICQQSSAILLVPEISLTPQMIDYFKKVFPEQIAVIHSRLGTKEKSKTFDLIRLGKKNVVIGSRSALFVPMKNPGIIIIDEEHEWTYKQDQSPRYHTRRVAEEIKKITGCKLVLGSATPDIESYYKARKKIYELVELKSRIKNSRMPKVVTVDLKREYKAEEEKTGKKRVSVIFSRLLLRKLKETLERKEQALIFLNKRGISSAVICRDCGYTPKCPDCDVAFTFHKKDKKEKFLCHYCSRIKDSFGVCPKCGSENIRYIGIGTQRLEKELKLKFPSARIMRADRDAVRRNKDYLDIYNSLKNYKVDFVVGTQMIAKGFDIEKISLVAVVLADIGLKIPDFRTNEKMFQILTQVAGRAGRRKKDGEVVVQTFEPENYTLAASAKHDYKNFYIDEIRIRREANLPPFSDIIKLIYVNKDLRVCIEEISAKKKDIKRIILEYRLKVKVSSAPALIPRIYRKYHWHIVLRGSGARKTVEKLDFSEGWRIDVDPIRIC